MSNTCCPPPKEENICCPPKDEQVNCCPSPGGEQASDCSPEQAAVACCPVKVTDDRPGYQIWPFVCDWLETPVGRVPKVATRLTKIDILGRWQMRWGIGRTRYSIAPGLYAIGHPGNDSPVLVTANYKMTFDILRRDMHDHDAWVLVLDTKGVNVWCAAGKGTFGTEELIQRIKSTRLEQVVSHRTLIIPQLGAPGVAAHEVGKGCGFKVIYGPVRSEDLPRFILNKNTATPEMRRVNFKLVDRLVLTPVELVNMRTHILWSLLVLFVLGGIGPDIFSFSDAWSRGGSAVITGLIGVITGAVIVPMLLPWLPGHAFAMKGAVAGLIVGFAGAALYHASLSWLNALALIMAVTTISSWCGMHFTGSSTFTSPSGVEKEMRQAIPAQAAAIFVAGLSWIAAAF